MNRIFNSNKQRKSALNAQTEAEIVSSIHIAYGPWGKDWYERLCRNTISRMAWDTSFIPVHSNQAGTYL